MDEAVAREAEGIDFDLGILSGMHEADILIRYHCLYLKMAVGRDNRHEQLRRRYDAAFRMHRQLLHGAVHRSVQGLQAVFLGGLEELFVKAGGFLLRFSKVLEGRVPVFILGLQPLRLVRGWPSSHPKVR
jgi:hypothetical protein